MPKDDDVIAGELIEASWGNQVVRDKLVQRATNAADLAAGWPVPQDGETVWQQDTDQLWVFDGTQWLELAQAAKYLLLSGGQMTGTLQANAGQNGLQTLTLTSDTWETLGVTLQCWRDPSGSVFFKGRIRNAFPGEIPEQAITTLPVGFRPVQAMFVTVFDEAKGTGAAVTIDTDGTMQFDDPVNLPGIWVDFSGVSFYAGW